MHASSSSANVPNNHQNNQSASGSSTSTTAGLISSTSSMNKSSSTSSSNRVKVSSRVALIFVVVCIAVGGLWLTTTASPGRGKTAVTSLGGSAANTHNDPDTNTDDDSVLRKSRRRREGVAPISYDSPHRPKSDSDGIVVAPPPVETAASTKPTTTTTTTTTPPTDYRRSSAERLAPFVNTHYTSAEENAAGGPEWSFDQLEREYKENIRSSVYPRLHAKPDDNQKDVLFVDGLQQCEQSRGFLVRVRQGGFKGLIVFMVYQRDDEANCQPLAKDFQPMFIFYRTTPRFEPSMQKFVGVMNYFRAKPFMLDNNRIGKVILAQPESIFWCNTSNPFDDIPSLNASPLPENYAKTADGTNGKNIHSNSIFGVFAKYNTDHPRVDRNVRESCSRQSGFGPNDHRLYPSFIGASNPTAMNNFCTLMSSFILSDPTETVGTIELLQRMHRPEVGNYLNANGVQLQPAARYEAAVCDAYVPEDLSKCMTCNQHTVLVGTTVCVRMVTYDTPNYTPYCDGPYRDAILEVPYNFVMEGYADENPLSAAHRIRDSQNLFSEVSDFKTRGGVSDECPNGLLGIFTAMINYKLPSVKDYIGSFLAHSDKCTRLVMMISSGTGLDEVAARYPNRLEIVNGNHDSPYLAQELRHCPAADYRFEVGQKWLEKNYKRFRYIISTDSRDYMWLSDPFKQLKKILVRYGHDNSEFMGAVAENYVATASTRPDDGVNNFLRDWVGPCGGECWRRWTQQTFTNGDPLAVLNSGHIIATSLALLHYYRFHVRMMRESHYQCRGADQGPFTYNFYGMLQAAHFPHKVLVFTTSRSGFANLPRPFRVSKRRRTDLEAGMTPEKERQLGFYDNGFQRDEDRRRPAENDPFLYEYTITDCDNNIISGLHQFDREEDMYAYLMRSPLTWKEWKPMILNGTYNSLARR